MPTAEQREYFARRATEVRTIVSGATDPDVRKALDDMASSYDTLVAEADRIASMRQRISTS